MGTEIWTQTTPRSDEESEEEEEAQQEDDLVVNLSTDPTPRTQQPADVTEDVRSLRIGRTPTPHRKKHRAAHVTNGGKSGKWVTSSGASSRPVTKDNPRPPVFNSRSKTDFHYLIKPKVVVPQPRVGMRQTLPTTLTSTYDVNSLHTEELSLFGDATGIPVPNGQVTSKTKPPMSSSSRATRYPSAPLSKYSDQSSCPPPPRMSVNVETRGRVGHAVSHITVQSQGQGQGHGQGHTTWDGMSESRERSRHLPQQSTGRRCDACTVESVRQKSQRSPRSSDEDAKSEKSSQSGERPTKEPTEKPFYEPLQLLRTSTDLSQMYHVNQSSDQTTEPKSARERVSLHTVSLPRRGLIKLTGLPYEMADPAYYDNRRERAEQREHVRRWLQTAGPPLPASRGDSRRACLIRDRTMIKQVKHGHRRLLRELAEREKGEMSDKLLNSLVTGLLQYEIPELPNMNKNMQNFVSVQPEIQRLDLKQRSQSAGVTGQNEWRPTESEWQPPPSGEIKHSAMAYKNYITSPRSGFEVEDKSSSRGSSAATTYYPRIGPSLARKTQKRPLGETRRLRLDDQFNLHKVLANAKKFHFRGLGDLPRDKVMGVLGQY